VAKVLILKEGMSLVSFFIPDSFVIGPGSYFRGRVQATAQRDVEVGDGVISRGESSLKFIAERRERNGKRALLLVKLVENTDLDDEDTRWFARWLEPSFGPVVSTKTKAPVPEESVVTAIRAQSEFASSIGAPMHG
jgi:hypothetical protein